MATPVGLIVRQVPSQAPPLVTPSDVGILGVILRSKRGTMNEAIRFSSYQDLLNYCLIDPNTPTALTLRNAYLEAGTFGLTTYVVRVGTGFTTARYNYSSSVGLVLDITPQALSTPGFDHVYLNITNGSSPNTYDITIELRDSSNATIGSPEIFNNVTINNLVSTINEGPNSSRFVKVVFYSQTPNSISVPITGNFNNPTGNALNTMSSTVTYTFKAGRLGQEDPGSWANGYAISFTTSVISPTSATLTVYVKDDNGNYVEVETITNLTSSNWVSKINNNSNYVVVTGNVDGDPMPYIPTVTPLSGGGDPSSYTLNDYIRGLVKFVGTPITEIMAPDVFSANWAKELDSFIKSQMPTVVGLVNLPYNSTITNISNTFTAADTNLSNDTISFSSLLQKEFRVAVYKGWGLTNNTLGSQTWVPSIGSVYGAYFIRKMMLNGGLPFVAPGGSNVATTTLLKLDDTNGKYTQTDLTYIVRNLGVNPLVNDPGLGIYVKTSRTMSTSNVFYDIHRQRSVGFLIKSFQSSLTFIEQEPHTIELRKKVVSTITEFLKTLYTAGMFDNTQGLSGAFLVKCDDQNNPPTLMEQRILVCEVAVKIVDTVETAFINIRSESRNLAVTGS